MRVCRDEISIPTGQESDRERRTRREPVTPYHSTGMITLNMMGVTAVGTGYLHAASSRLRAPGSHHTHTQVLRRRPTREHRLKASCHVLRQHLLDGLKDLENK